MRRGRGSFDEEGDEEVELECKVLHRTPNGVKIETADDELWLPRQYVTEGKKGIITIPEWLAKDRGLI